MRKLTTTLLVAVSVLALGLVGAAPAHAAARMQIHRVYYNSPGSDNRSNASLNAEWVQIRNTSRVPVTITGFVLHDRQGHRYKFPPTTVSPGKDVYVHTGSGRNNPWHRYWGRRAYVWNNTGDGATLRDTYGRWLDACAWGNGRGSIYC